jgi:hypothetical protein
MQFPDIIKQKKEGCLKTSRHPLFIRVPDGENFVHVILNAFRQLMIHPHFPATAMACGRPFRINIIYNVNPIITVNLLKE